MKGYAGGFFSLALDQGNNQERPGLGHHPAFIRSVDGGFFEGSIISEALGADMHQVKHLGTVDIKPISFETGLASSRVLLEWIQQTWNLQANMRSGRIDHGAPSSGAIRSHAAQEFYDALLTEVTFPALSSESGSESAYLKITIQPGRVKLIDGDETSLTHNFTGQQLEWTKATFALDIGGQRIRAKAIDSFSVKQHVKKLYTGRERLPELIPAGLEISNLSITCNESDAGYFFDWYRERIEKGSDEMHQDRSGALIFKSHDGDELFEISLDGVGLFSLTMDKSVAGSQDVKKVKIGLYVERMKLSFLRAFEV